MTNDEARALGERWVKAGGGWRDGMLAGGHLVPRRMLFSSVEEWSSTYGYALPLPRISGRRGVARPPSPSRDPKAWPDLRDPATRGAALEVVRERWGRPHLSLSPGVNAPWDVWCWDDDWHSRLVAGTGPTEAAALVAALEASPRT